MPVSLEKEELLDQLQEIGAEPLVKKYRRNLLSSRLLVDLYNEHPEENVLLFLALYPTAPGHILQSISENYDDPTLLAALAKNPRCPPTLLIKIAKEGSEQARESLASNRLQNPRVTEILVRDPSLHVRMALAKNPAILSRFHALLTQDPEPAVRVALAGASKLSEEIILTLEDDTSPVVRNTLYTIGRPPPLLRQYWADSDSEEKQTLLLARKTLTDAELKSLCKSPHPAIQKAALQRHTPSECELLHWAESENNSDRQAIANRPDLPVSIQHILAGDPLLDVRTALASNPAIDSDVARCVAASNDPEPCCALAENPAIPTSVKTELCLHENRDVQLRMLYRDDLTDDLLELLINETGNFNIIEHMGSRGQSCANINPSLLPTILAHHRPSVRAVGAGANALSTSQQNALTRDPIVSVRKALVQNPALDPATLEKLSNDWNPEIAEQAAQRLQNHEPKPQPKEPTLSARIVQFFSE